MLGVFSCVTYVEKQEVKISLERANDSMILGNFQDALTENNKAISQPSQPLGDRTLFQRGIIYSHPHNSDRNYQKAIANFREIIQEFPQSNLINAAEVFVVSLQKIVDMENIIKEQKKKIKITRRKLEKGKAHIKKLNIQIAKFRKQIKEFKEIDLNIEEKKRNTISPQ
jgi:tetratricopeptide (TPR) repeat protein